MTNIFLVGIGGFLGAVSRFGFYHFSNSYIKNDFPLATLLINTIGCAMAGAVFEYYRQHPAFPTVTLFFIVGFLGSFTTFSAFSLESIQLLRSSGFWMGVLSVGVNVVLCLAATTGGMWLAVTVSMLR